MNETDKLIEDQLKTLPGNLRKALEVVPWKSLVNQIAGLHNLKPEQKEIIERETMFILYGFESLDDYVANMAREAAIDENLAFDIATEVNEKIFKVISDKVEELEKAVPTPAPVAVPEIPPANLPMVEKGETAHEVPHVEITNPKLQITDNNQNPTSKPQTAQIPVNEPPKFKYPGGADPYREPLN
ncbi:MAG: hypothetical protein A2758_00595 [Candidatus Zambryskibacteria bacterium RIFCSPHIGHO2_01_FULL_49_18]|uniref:Uncharacterized protein n=2 Tax=Candidatus Zambryskiibacteriota TaxID=1817925 RepID=A0A1G2T2T2_9BACT|nr:MAG: hypothetical protein A2758_00595 [Candidatus Zambryskibacteria bacterium RIFCSPHIGHO2_01_FULL_49_18]OHB05923.1 MAG: hypothetical protein A3A26_03180 [Candidatus Zambryskibacteria bacterium RIFCSPLOWO2_01_FULL_47_14]